MKKILLQFVIFIAFTQLAFAHSFHYEIQITNQLKTNAKQQLTALEMSWHYDMDVSKAMLQDQKNLKKLSDKLIDDLDVLGFFTQIKLNGKVVETAPVKTYSLKKNKDNTLQLNFTLPLKTPVSLAGNSTLSFNHADPAIAAILYYKDASHIKMDKTLSTRCKASVVEKGDFTEGEFPQIVKVSCND